MRRKVSQLDLRWCPLRADRLAACLNGKPEADHNDQGASARDEVLVKLEEVTGDLDQGSRREGQRESE